MAKFKEIAIISIIVGIILTFIIWGRIERNAAILALKNSDTVIAVITKKTPGRDQSAISVKYIYRDSLKNSEFDTSLDSFEVGDKILLKIAKKYPEKYISIIRKIKT